MHLTVLTAVLLSVGFLGVVTDGAHTTIAHIFCMSLKDVPCGNGWNRIDAEYCVKYFQTPKSYDDAQKHCESLKSELVPMKTIEQSWNAVCLTMRASIKNKSVWIGVRRSGGKFIHADGSKLEVGLWAPGQPDNYGEDEDCVEVNHKEWGLWNDDNCSDENAFMCAKKM
ncbi:C-type isolectin Sp-CL4-like [Clinocottus analis]|uniref:C-type isolectin Sp-CL4-like n=1 Tax=Clinocottus analis TaxID=304258 RepID=UPI0035BEB7F9